MSRTLKLTRRKRTVPVFFAADDNYVKYMMVTMQSLIDNTSSSRYYKLYVLHTDITEENQGLVKTMEKTNCRIRFVNVTEELKKIQKKIAVRDYYTATTYYRIFIPEMFREYDKVVYIDSDTIVREDIANLYDSHIGNNYIGAIRDQLVVQTDIYGEYVEKVLGISRGAYFNAGVVVINCHEFRRNNLLKEFTELLNTYTFVVAQDQDYLNILCKDKVSWLDPRWNVQMIGKLPFQDNMAKLIHYNLSIKPWQDKECRFGTYFWQVAENTVKYEELMKGLESSNTDDARLVEAYGENLQNLAISEINNMNNYFNRFGDGNKPKLTRVEVIRRIEELERKGSFDQDVEDDPEGRELKPDEVDYLRRKMRSKLSTKYAFKMAYWFVGNLIKKKQLVIKEIKGLENLKSLNTGAIITCNHFNAFDSFAVQIAFDKAKLHRKKLFRVISEANYTTFPGFYGFLMRNCNTLPLSRNGHTMKKFLMSLNLILQKGHFVLVYPEQSMWWNYRKPKPLKKGAYTFAVSNKVPVVPCFVTMEDTDIMDADGFPVQAYTIHIGEAIYPEKNKKKSENIDMLMEKNARAWKDIYENFYGIELMYSNDKEK